MTLQRDHQVNIQRSARDRTEPDSLWYRDAVIYQLHVKAFMDSNGDGVGDFRGLTEKLDYIADLGVNAVWLLPFYPSPMRDDGYDVADYRRVNPAYGSLADFRRLVDEAHRRGIRVITELVVNHTSDQHGWFQASRRAPRGSSKRNYYVWSDSDAKYAGTRIIFTDTETSNWAWDPLAQQYYWHRFFSHQPDLNYANPSVVRAVMRVMQFWLDMGVDGLRLDAVPYLCEREGTSNENLPETHAVLKQLRAMVDEHYPDRMLLAEANQWPEDVLEYFGDADECHMAYHFPLMPRMYMAMAQEDRHPIVEILEQTPAIPDTCQWAIFLRNHDELTLEMVTDEERDYMYETYARDPRARINLGIRRRLAPLMDNDLDKVKLLKSVLLSMPGSPILYYGDEIGMGDNIYLGDRNAVRTPMQWSPDRNAGFSRSDPQQLYLPPVMDPVFGYEVINVEAQSRHVTSLLNWTRRLIAVRRSSQAFGRGSLTVLAPGNRRVLAYLREHDSEIILCVANLARAAQPVELDLSRFRGMVPVDMLGRTPFPPIGELPYLLTLAGHGFFWFRLTREADVPEWHVEALPRADLVTLVLVGGWQSFFPERVPATAQIMAENLLRRLTARALPRYLSPARPFAAPSAVVNTVAIERRLLWKTAEGTYLLLWVRTDVSDDRQRCFLPLSLAWGGDQAEPIRELLPVAVARVRERAVTGVLFEAFYHPPFCRLLVDGMARSFNVALNGAAIRFTATSAAVGALEAVNADSVVTVLPGDGIERVAWVGESIRLKLLRQAGEAPATELEICRFLTERTRFRHFPRLLGAVELLADGTALARWRWRRSGYPIRAMRGISLRTILIAFSMRRSFARSGRPGVCLTRFTPITRHYWKPSAAAPACCTRHWRNARMTPNSRRCRWRKVKPHSGRKRHDNWLNARWRGWPR
jgi:maltose alpha-D-glucosyltransferase / alpha-amylase